MAHSSNALPVDAPSEASHSPSRWRRRAMYTFVSLASLLFGYDLGMIASAIVFIQRDLGLDAGMVGLVVSIVTAGTIAGMVFSGRVSDRFGRKPILVGGATILGVSAIGMALAQDTSALLVFRILMGLGLAATTTTVPTYLAELSPTARRGGITSLHQLMIAIGTLVAFLVGYGLSESGAWRLIIGAGAVLAAVIVIGALFQPESPRWLMRHGREDEARAALMIGAPAEADQVLAQLRQESRSAGSDRSAMTALLRDRSIRRVLLLGCTMAALQQLIGVNTIVYYAPKILQAAGFGTSTAILNSVGLGLLSIIATTLELRVVDRVGRRRLLLLGAGLMIASMAALGLVFLTGGHDHLVGKVTAVAGLAVFKFAFSLSWGPLLWVTLPEIFPLGQRAAGVSFSALTGQIAQFAVTLVFPIMLVAGPALIFFVFAGMGVLALVFAAKLLRELTGKSLELIESETTGT